MCTWPCEQGRKREGASRAAAARRRVVASRDSRMGDGGRTEPITIQFPSEKSRVRPRPLHRLRTRPSVGEMKVSQLSDDRNNTSCQQTSDKKRIQWSRHRSSSGPGEADHDRRSAARYVNLECQIADRREICRESRFLPPPHREMEKENVRGIWRRRLFKVNERGRRPRGSGSALWAWRAAWRR